MNQRQRLCDADKLFAILVIVISTYLAVCHVVNAETNGKADKAASIRADISGETNGRDKRAFGDTSRLSVWSNWSGWSTCSRTCGGGAAYRTRHCMSRIPTEYMADMPPICSGATHEYTACNIEECPRGSADYRATQCSVFNNKEPLVVWIPLASYGCNLLCQTLDGLYMLNFGRALDGTECLTENNKKGMCISASCVRVGCDGVLESDVEEDACGICGGWNHTCGHVKELFMDAFPSSAYYTYNSIATIPSGATNIRVTDVSGLNYLALRDEYDKFVLNGDWVIEWPGEYHRAGTSLSYQRYRNGTEIVLSPGPTDRDLQIMIIFREQNPGVEYEYWSDPQSARQQPSHLQSGEFTENEIAGRHEFPTFTTKSPSTAPGPPTTTEPPTTTRKPTTTMKHTTTFKTTTVSPSTAVKPKGSKERGDRPKKEKKPKKRCGKCQKVRNRVENYCKSDFVLHVQILSKHKEPNDQTSYDVEIVSTYKNTMHLSYREYLWVPNRCNCPRLKPGRQYIVSGNKHYFEELGESKLVVDRDNLVNSWKKSLHEKWDKIQANQLFLCSSDTRTER